MSYEVEVIIKPKSLDYKKLLLDESLNDLFDGKVYSQEQVIKEFNQWNRQ